MAAFVDLEVVFGTATVVAFVTASVGLVVLVLLEVAVVTFFESVTLLDDKILFSRGVIPFIEITFTVLNDTPSPFDID